MEGPDINITEAVEAVVAEWDADIILYAGAIDRGGASQIIDICASSAHPKCLLVLTTAGGDVHAAFLIARALQRTYREGLHIFINGPCKSAGTLIALAATGLVMGDRGELGPLDVQLEEPDEIGALQSGLVTTQALASLKEESFDVFETNFLKLRTRSGLQITTKTAAEIASALAVGLFSGIYAQIDPLRLGVADRSMRLAYHYGERLIGNNQNVKTETWQELITNYPSHSCVIDRLEAVKFFEQVKVPSNELDQLAGLLGNLDPEGPPVTMNLTTAIIKEGENGFELEASKQASNRPGAEDEQTTTRVCQIEESCVRTSREDVQRH
jgi:hypothetical protein